MSEFFEFPFPFPRGEEKNTLQASKKFVVPAQQIENKMPNRRREKKGG